MSRATISAASDLRLALARQEFRTGAMLDDAAALGLPMWETTLSQLLWFTLASDPATMRRLNVRVFSQVEEGGNGADWLWSFTSTTSSMVMPLLVQAKRLRDGGYTINQPARSGTQAQLLSSYARRQGIPAAYAFYNPQTVATRVSQRCSWESRLCPLAGITIADAHRVAAIACGTSRQSLDPNEPYFLPSGPTIADTAWPLSCAICCGVNHTWPPGDFPVAVGAALRASGVYGTLQVDQESSFVSGLRDAATDLRVSAYADGGDRWWVGEGDATQGAAAAFLAEHGISGLVSVEVEARN